MHICKKTYNTDCKIPLSNYVFGILLFFFLDLTAVQSIWNEACIE